MTVTIVGASGALGRALAEALASAGNDLLLAGGDGADLLPLQAHLQIVYGIRVRTVPCRIAADGAWREALLPALDGAGALTGIAFPLGAANPDDNGLLPPQAARDLLEVNLLAVVQIMQHVLPGLLAGSGAWMVAYGSIAALRGRSRNVVYAAAKRGLESYCESLRHMAQGSALRVHLIRLGYMSNQRTFGLRLPLPVASPEQVARATLRLVAGPGGASVYPAYWRAVGWLLAALPWALFRRLRS